MNVIARNRWTGTRVEAFMIGGMNPPDWFQLSLERGDALISDDWDLDAKSAVPFVGPDGDTMVILLATDLTDVQRGVSGDWVVHFSDWEDSIFTASEFRSTFIITNNGEIDG